TFPILKRLCGPGLSVTEEEAMRAMAQAFLRLKIALEPGGAVSLASALFRRDEIEGDVSEWTVENGAQLNTGGWEQADPIGTISGSDLVAPDDDATANGDLAFVTQNGAPGGQAGTADVDGGPTHLLSPTIDLNGTDATISFSYWFYSSNGVTDELAVSVSNDNGNNWTPVGTYGSTNSTWRVENFVVGSFVTPTSQVRVRFTATDLPNDSLTEAGIDNFQVTEFVCQACSVPADCDDGNPCTSGVCLNSTCQFVPNRDACDDNDPCTNGDVCMAGSCMGSPVANCQSCVGDEDCDDSDVCTDDACVNDVCEFTNNSASCDDGDVCTENDVCNAGTCAGTVIADCEVCFGDEDCDDMLFCNGAETCNAGECVTGAPPCGAGPCDEVSDTCTIPLQPRGGDPLPDLTPEQLTRFFDGRALFSQDFQEADGLGPIFNQSSCSSCHNNPVGGAGSQFVVRAGVQDKGGFDSLEQYGGSLFQKLAIDDACLETVPEELPGIIVTQRVTPGMLGYGLVESIPDADIIAIADNQPAGLNGRAHMVEALEAPGIPRVGKFGWKSVLPTMLSFTADASKEEMGITNRLIPTENDPNGIFPPELADCDSVPDPEDDGPEGEAFIDLVADFQRYLAAPPQTPKSGMTGETIFMNIGCGDCHVPQFITGSAPEAALSNKVVRAYSDFLLHDMGLLGDGIENGDATGREFRTTPLMGLNLRNPLMHDGSAAGGTFASRVTTAIDLHNAVLSEGQPSAQAYAALSPSDKDLVIDFLESLGRAEFDFDSDQVVDEDDWVAFRGCFTGPGSFYTADDACAIGDIDQDGDVDDVDFDRFLAAYQGPVVDCNNNATLDFIEIITGTGPDADVDGDLDHCGAPALAQNGPRSIEVAPIEGPDDVALRVTSQDYPCLTLYVGADGTLTDTPFLQSPAAWGDVLVTGGDLVPESSYRVQVEFNGGVVGELGTISTPVWGDIDNSGSASLADVQLIVLAFQQQFDSVSLEAADIWPCEPNGVANFSDIQQGVLAFQGFSYTDVECTLPCE
ncbi:MAG: di-heme oxidoredictase family protein, partial [Phycisphaerae bacterium]